MDGAQRLSAEGTDHAYGIDGILRAFREEDGMATFPVGTKGNGVVWHKGTDFCTSSESRKKRLPEARFFAKINAMREFLPFFRTWLSHRREVASVAPSSRRTVKTVCDAVSRDARQVVVEFGPGTGPITKGLLENGVLTRDSKVILIESNAVLAAYLRKHVDDPRVSVVNDSAEHAETILRDAGVDKADAVISGIPYSYLSPEMREDIVKASADLLRAGGVHVVYQVTRSVEPHLRAHFPKVRRKRSWLNIPPLQVYTATKERAAQ